MSCAPKLMSFSILPCNPLPILCHFPFLELMRVSGTLRLICVGLLCVQDTTCSTGALNHLQGAILHSSAAGEGMRLEYPLEMH